MCSPDEALEVARTVVLLIDIDTVDSPKLRPCRVQRTMSGKLLCSLPVSMPAWASKLRHVRCMADTYVAFAAHMALDDSTVCRAGQHDSGL